MARGTCESTVTICRSAGRHYNSNECSRRQKTLAVHRWGQNKRTTCTRPNRKEAALKFNNCTGIEWISQLLLPSWSTEHHFMDYNYIIMHTKGIVQLAQGNLGVTRVLNFWNATEKWSFSSSKSESEVWWPKSKAALVLIEGLIGKQVVHCALLSPDLCDIRASTSVRAFWTADAPYEQPLMLEKD